MRARLPRIYLRHVAREMAAQTLIVAAVLLAVLVIYQFSFVLGRAADGQIDGATVLRLAWLTLRTNLGVILPLAVMLGVVLALGRLCWDSEVAAAEAAGVPRGALYIAAAVVVLPAAVVAGWVAFADGPAAAREAVQLRLAALRTQVTRGLEAGAFRTIGAGTTLHFQAQDDAGRLLGVFIERELRAAGEGAPQMQVVLAGHARYRLDEAAGVIEVDLFDGRSHQGTPGRLDWRVMQFEHQRVTLPMPLARLPGAPRTDQLDNRALLQSTDPRLQAELHWRIGWVVAVLVLGWVAVPLGVLAPRQGRHARVPWAVLLFALHAGLLTSGKSLLERGETPAWAGLWWVPAVVLALALLPRGLPGLVARLRHRPITS